MTIDEKVEQLAQYLPSLRDVADPATVQGIVQVWYTALDMSPWETFDQA